jgi:hypothetical protein
MKLYKYFNYIALAISFIFITIGAYEFATGDKEGARAFLGIGLLAGVLGIIKLIVTTNHIPFKKSSPKS